MKPMKTISIVGVSALAGLFVGQAHVALSNPPQQKGAQSLLRSNRIVIQDPNGKGEGIMAASKRNGGVFCLYDPPSRAVSVLAIANPPSLAVISSSAKYPAFIRFAFSKNPKTHVISPVIQMMDSSGKASEMDQTGKVRPIQRPNPRSWYVQDH